MKKANSILLPTLTLFLLTLLALTPEGHSQSLNSQDQEALKQTQDFLKNSQERNKYTKENAQAQKDDDMVTKLFGGDATASEEIYALASDILANVVKDANGDVNKMQEAMNKFSSNPAAFAETWTPEQKAKLAKLAEKVKRPDLKPK